MAGAAANQPLAPAGGGAATGRSSTSTLEDQTRNFDVSRTTTTTLAKTPRLQKISVAVLVDGKDGQPRPKAELDRLGELARKAVGFDAARGDEFDITSAPFTRSEDPKVEPPPEPGPVKPWMTWAAAAFGVLVLLGLAFLVLRGKKGGRSSNAPRPRPADPGRQRGPARGRPGPRRRSAAAAVAALSEAPTRPALADPAAALRERARELAMKDPTRAAHILRAWVAQEQRPARNPNG